MWPMVEMTLPGTAQAGQGGLNSSATSSAHCSGEGKGGRGGWSGGDSEETGCCSALSPPYGFRAGVRAAAEGGSSDGWSGAQQLCSVGQFSSTARPSVHCPRSVRRQRQSGGTSQIASPIHWTPCSALLLSMATTQRADTTAMKSMPPGLWCDALSSGRPFQRLCPTAVFTRRSSAMTCVLCCVDRHLLSPPAAIAGVTPSLRSFRCNCEEEGQLRTTSCTEQKRRRLGLFPPVIPSPPLSGGVRGHNSPLC